MNYAYLDLHLSPQLPNLEHRPHNRREQGGGGPPGLDFLDKNFCQHFDWATSTTGSTSSAPTIPHRRAGGGANGILSTGSNNGQKQIS